MSLSAGKRRPGFIGAIPGLLTLAIMVWGLVEAIRAVGSYLQSLQSELAVAFVTAASAVVVAVVSLALTKAWETKAKIRDDLRQKKTPVYEHIIGTILTHVFSQIMKRNGSQAPEVDLMQFFATTTEKLSIWGSDEVLLAWTAFKLGAAKSPEKTIFFFENLVLAIRKDIGHKNKGLGTNSILRLFVNDIDELQAAVSKAS